VETGGTTCAAGECPGGGGEVFGETASRHATGKAGGIVHIKEGAVRLVAGTLAGSHAPVVLRLVVQVQDPREHVLAVTAAAAEDAVHGDGQHWQPQPRHHVRSDDAVQTERSPFLQQYLACQVSQSRIVLDVE
jgi:hypothetical protein